MILQPQVAFPIVRQIANHTDTNTYYVQAIVRDADGTTLATVNLDDQSGQRFSKAYQVPADPSGQGRYISIVTSVYTDSGYTTKSANYGDEENTYLVFNRVRALRGGGGGGAGVDYFRVREIIKDELSKLPAPETFDYSRIPEPERYEMRWDEIIMAMEVLRQGIIKIPTEHPSQQPILDAIAGVKTAVTEKDVTPVTDLSPVMQEILTLKEEVADDMRMDRDIREANHGELKDIIKDSIEDAIENTEFQSMFTTSSAKRRNREREEAEPLDITKLAQ